MSSFGRPNRWVYEPLDDGWALMGIFETDNDRMTAEVTPFAIDGVGFAPGGMAERGVDRLLKRVVLQWEPRGSWA